MEKQDVDETKKRAPDDEDNQKMSKKSRADASASEDPKSDIESKRAYNRLNAARHRQRQKDALAKLTEQVREKDERIKLLDRENETLKAQLQVLAAQNQQLVGSLQLFSAGQAQAQQHQQQIPMAHHNFDVRNLRDFAQQPNPLSLSQAATIDPQTLLAYQKLFQQSGKDDTQQN